MLTQKDKVFILGKFVLGIFSKTIAYIFLLFLLVYIYIISAPLKFFFTGSVHTCRFEPTCGDYAAITLKKRPLCTALWLIGKRLLKCHPFYKGELDNN